MIVNDLKKKFEGLKGSWVKEFPNVLWMYRMTPRRSTSESHFFMTYGTEAVILIEISLLSSRVACFAQGHNNESIIGNLDALEE